MWKNEIGKEPIIVDSNDWTRKEFDLFCRLFGIDPLTTEMFVIRENYVTEVLTNECSIPYENISAA